MAPLIRVLCVDDHPLMRDGISYTLQQEEDISVVGEAANGEEVITAFRLYKPDVTLLDLQMPVMSGIEANGRYP